ncbi:MAG: AtpZ/AtpI family protein [Epulopiscium sp.]|nr:AtpZ/AtpI family protein [Candidatus Epulonipiscium sp.]
MVIPIVLGVWLGGKLDNKLGTKGLFLIVFISLGVASGFRNVYFLVYKRFDNKKDDKDE